MYSGSYHDFANEIPDGGIVVRSTERPSEMGNCTATSVKALPTSTEALILANLLATFYLGARTQEWRAEGWD